MEDWMQDQQQINQQAQQINQQAQQIKQQDQQQINQQAQQINQQGQQQINQQGQQQINQEAQLQLNQQAQVNFPPAHAHAAAAGEAVQQMAPARKTFKARRAEKRHAREAREHCPVGDIVTYDIKHQLEFHHKQRTTLFDRNFPVLGINPVTNEEIHDMSKNLSGVDRRVLKCFTHGFRTDRAGRPATADDKRYQREDEAFYDAFCSTDYVRRAPYLQRMVEEVLSFNLKEDMFSDQSMRSNAAVYKSMADRIVYMENVMKDKNNAFFFDSPLCPVKKEVLKKALDIAGPMVPAFMTACQKRGVEPDDREARYVSNQTAINAYSMTAEYNDAAYKGKPEEYQNFIESIKSEETQKPTPEMYQQIRSFIEGDVQKLLDCDAEKLNALSEEELRRLYSVSLGVDKCLTLKHPEQTDNVGRALTLKDDLIGQRRLEYEYKLALLRGLVERADGFKKQGKQTIKAASERYKNQKTPGKSEFIEFFDSICDISISSLVVNAPKFDAITKEFFSVWDSPKEEREAQLAEAKKIDEKIQQLKSEGKLAEAKQLAEAEQIDEKIKRLQREEKIANAMERLKVKDYFSLAYSEAQLKDMGLPQTIGVPLFRSFYNFLRYEAVHTLLTPEEFEQMLFNLGAGAGLLSDLSKNEEQLEQAVKKEEVEEQQKLEAKKKDIQEQWDEAIKMNNEGLDTLRMVTAAQYDMLERKYGDSLEHITIKDIMEHYLDYAKDFANVQEDILMATKFPGFIRKDSKYKSDDERLLKQIQYYNQCYITITGIIPAISANDELVMKVSDESMQNRINAVLLEDEDVKTAREYLMKNNSSFQHPTDWSQKVKSPADGN